MRTRLVTPQKLVVVCGIKQPIILRNQNGNGSLTSTELRRLVPNSWTACDDIDPPSGVFRFLLGAIVNIFGCLSLFVSLVCIATDTLPVPYQDNGQTVPLFLFWGLLVLSCVLTTLIHEACHVVLGNTSWRNVRCTRNVLRTNLNHILAWKKGAALTAISTGPCIDYIFMACFMCIYKLTDINVFLAIAYVALVRSLWEFNIFKKRDLRLLLNILFDKPEGITRDGWVSRLCGFLFDAVLVVGLILLPIFQEIGQ